MLCAETNDTYAINTLDKIGLKNVLSIAGRNEIIGSFGTCLDCLLIKKPLRKCLIQGSIELGTKLANGSYSAVLGMLQRNELDLFIRGQPDHLHEPWLRKSVPLKTAEVMIAHPIRDHENKYFNLLLNNFKLGFILTMAYILSLVGILLASFLINEFARRIRLGEKRRIDWPKRKMDWLKRIVLALSSFRVKKRLSAIGMFVLFVYLFLWLTQLLLTNNIQTNKVVVDTSQLIKTDLDLFNTEKVGCFFQNDEMLSLATSAPTKSVLSKIYWEKSLFRADKIEQRKILNRERCVVEQNEKMLHFLKFMFSAYLVVEEAQAKIVLGSLFMLQDLVRRIWIYRKPVYSYNKVFYYSLRHKENDERIGRAVMRQAENGFFEKLYACLDQVGRVSARKSEVTVFESLAAYVEDYSGFSDLLLDNFQSIFVYYFLICSLVFVAFCVHHLVKFVKQRIVFLPSPLRSCLARFAPSHWARRRRRLARLNRLRFICS